MKTDFAQILIPRGKTDTQSSSDSLSFSTISNNNNKTNSTIIKCLLVTSLVFTIIVTAVTTGFIIRYEDKLESYEDRIFKLESELELFFKRVTDDTELFEYETHLPASSHNEDEEPEIDEDMFEEYEEPTLEGVKRFNHEADNDSESDEFGKVKLVGDENRSRRRKRQIPYPNLPTFGPNVERTEGGVPIVEQSYLSSAGVTLTPRPRLSLSVPTTDSEGFRLYEGLSETGGLNERQSIKFSRQQNSQGILPHHQVSAAWSERKNEGESGGQRQRLELKSGGTESAFGSSLPLQPHVTTEGTYSSSSRRTHSHRATGAGSTSTYQSSGSNSNSNPFISGGTGSSGATYHRNSRVPATGDYFYPTKSSSLHTRSVQYPPLRKLGDGEGEVIARVLQTETDVELDNESPNKQAIASANLGQGVTAEASSTRIRTEGYRRQRNQQGSSSLIPSTTTGSSGSQSNLHRTTTGERRKFGRKTSEENSGEISISHAEAWVEGPKPIAGHFVADVSNYTTAHRHYEGNGRLRNADGIFSSWKPAEWMTADSGDGKKNFVLSPSGVLTVKNTGLYYIYAQVHYLDEHDINGFTIQINTDPFLQCTTMTETHSSSSKSNSCFTAGVHYLKENDRIVIKDIESNRYSIFKPEKSFFGLMKIGDFQ